MTRTRSTAARWILAWPGGAVIGVTNGVVRQATYGKRLSESAGHQVSTVTALVAFAAYFRFLDRRWPTESNRQALTVGGAWLALTVLFEFGFGRLVAKASWDELLADYNLARGRTWPLVLAWIGTGPLIARRARCRYRARTRTPARTRANRSSTPRRCE